MAEYVALDPNVEVIGIAVMSFLSGMGDAVVPILKKYNIYPLEKDVWYKQQDVLDVYKAVNEENFMNLVAVGMKIPDQAVWPPEVNSVHDALASIDVAYSMNHRGGKMGGYQYEKTGKRSGIMVCDNPYPSDFDYGLIYRTTQKFRDQNGNFLVQLDDEKPSRKKGGDACTYIIEW